MSCSNGSCCSTDITKKTITFEVGDAIANEIERCYYEFNGLLQVLTQFTSTSPYKPDETRYSALLSEYMTRYIQYNLLFEEITQEALRSLNISSTEVLDRTINFYEKTLYLNLKEE